MKFNGSLAYVKIVKELIGHQKRTFEGTLLPNNKLLKEKSIEQPPEIQQMRRLLDDKKKALES